MSFADHIIRPLHDPRAYRDAARKGVVTALWHLGRLSLLTSLTMTIVATLWAGALWRERVRPVLGAVPTITIRDGVASVDGPQPWSRRVLVDRGGREWVLTIDTTTDRAQFGARQAGVLLTRTHLRIRVA